MRLYIAPFFSMIFVPMAWSANIWTGTITTTTTVFNTTLVGSVDYSIDTTTDIMTLSNKTGGWLTEFGPSATITLYALDDLTSNAGALYNPVASTFDVTDGHFSTPGGGLGAIPGDGWYWASAQSGNWFYLVIGGENGASTMPMNDWLGQAQANLFDWTTASNTSRDIGGSGVTFSTPILQIPIPESSSAIFSCFGALLLAFRKRRVS